MTGDLYDLATRLHSQLSSTESTRVNEEYRRLLISRFNERDCNIPSDWSTHTIEELAEVNGLDTEKLYREFLKEKLEEVEA